MGMTDRQFSVFQKLLLRNLQQVRKEIKQGKEATSETLEQMIKDLEDDLKLP